MSKETELVQNDQQLDQAVRAVATIEKTESAPKLTPMEVVEQNVSDFLEKAIAVTIGSTRLSQALENSFIDDLKNGTMKTDEKITLFNIERSSSNDRLFKLLSPTFGVITAKQQAEIQAQSKREQAQAAAVQVNVQAGGNSLDAQVASTTPASVEAGLNAMFQMMQSAALRKAKLAAETSNAEVVEN